MAAFAQVIVAYFLGGITFVPLLLGIAVCHAYYVLPRRDASNRLAGGILPSDDFENDEKLKEQLLQRSHEPDAAAGYFAVCREYVPGGVNGKPPERKTPAGETIATESPSVYQSMYRSIFDRGKAQTPSIESSKVVKKARNIFYIVLRHGHLLLFDNAEQLEVRHVIALANYNIDIYAGAETMSEGELWIKRNCIRLTKRGDTSGSSGSSMPFFLFSDNCSEKEDFYHCLLRNRESGPESEEDSPSPLMFDTEDMIKLIRQLHVSEESSHTRWLNALIGRLFLALYKTSDVEAFVRKKITRKMSRVPKPAFITSLKLEEIDMGHSAPILTNFKLKEMTVDGALTIEADLKYTGNFKLVTSAVARIPLGSRFKPREVSLILAGIFKRVEGHLLIHFKPPPSNRIWLSFESMPKLDISLEPIVSSRQITYGVILRALESRVREVFSDTLVYPNWDDSPFTNTQDKRFRGGIYKEQGVSKSYLVSKEGPMPELDLNKQHTDTLIPDDELPQSPIAGQQEQEKTMSMPNLSESPPKSAKHDHSQRDEAETLQSEEAIIGSEARSKNDYSEKPKILRTHSFATAADPIVSKGPSSIDATRRPTPRRNQQDATSAMKKLSSMSPESSPRHSPVGSPVKEGSPMRRRTSSAASTKGTLDSFPDDSPRRSLHPGTSQIGSRSNTELISTAASSEDTPADMVESPTSLTSNDNSTRRSQVVRSLPRPVNTDRKAMLNQSITSATNAAKNWGWGVINRQHERKSSIGASNEPVGRGQPLPPPGVPLPRPSGWSGNALGSLRRKPVPSTSSSQARAATDPINTNSSSSSVATNPEMITSNDYRDKSEVESVKQHEQKDSTLTERIEGDILDTSDEIKQPTLNEQTENDEKKTQPANNAENDDIRANKEPEEAEDEVNASMMFPGPDLDTTPALGSEETVSSPLWSNEFVQAS